MAACCSAINIALQANSARLLMDAYQPAVNDVNHGAGIFCAVQSGSKNLCGFFIYGHDPLEFL